MDSLTLGDFDRVIASEAGIAKTVVAIIEKRIEALPTQVGERIGSDEPPDLLNRLIGGKQLTTRGRIDSVEARVGGGWRRDPHVDFARARLTKHRNDLAHGGAAYQRIFDQ